MIIWFRWGHDLFGEVNDARGVFVVKTRFLVAYFLPILPYESYVCVMGEAPRIRRHRVIRRTEQRDGVQVLDYAAAARTKKQIVGHYALPHNVPRSLLACYLRTFAGIAALVWLLSLSVYATEARIPALITCLSCAVLAPAMFVLPRSSLFQDITYERAVRLAALARVPESVMRELQVRYGRATDSLLIHGFPCSSKILLYAYVDGEIDQRTAAKVAGKLNGFVFGRRWAFSEVWPVHQWTTADGAVQRDLGVIIPIPVELPAKWESDIAVLCKQLRKLSGCFQVVFAAGFCDLGDGTNEDLMVVGDCEPDLGQLKDAIRTKAASASHCAGRADLPL